MAKRRASGEEQFADTKSVRSLLFSGIPASAPTESLLAHIKGVDLESVERSRDGGKVKIGFFSYFDLYKVYTRISSSPIALGGSAVAASHVSEKEPLESRVKNTHSTGATRNVMLGNLEDYMSSDFIREEAERYGEVESLKHIKDRKVAYVEFFSFTPAVKFVSTVKNDALFQNVKVAFGRDKCSHEEDPDSPGTGLNARTLYLGNTPSDVSPAEILGLVKGGEIFSMKTLRDKKCAFVTFIDHLSAAVFLEYTNFFPMVVRGARLRVGWGKSSILPVHVPLLCFAGATRNLVIGSIDRSIPAERIEGDAEKYGEIEKKALLRDQGALHVNYCNLLECHNAYLGFKKDPFYGRCTVSFGRDVCASTSAQELMFEMQKAEFR